MTGVAPCAWCGAALSGRVVRAMHRDCYRKALATGAVKALRPAPSRPFPDRLDALVDAIVLRRAAT